MEMSGLFLAMTGDPRSWPSYALVFLNIQLERGVVGSGCAAVCVNMSSCVFLNGGCLCVRACVCVGGVANKHHDPSHLETANWQLISRIDSVVRSQVPAPLLAPPAR